MPKFLFIESQDPLEDRGAEEYLGYALELSRQKHEVTVFLVENAALAARKGSQVPVRDALREAGATLRADELALRERGIGVERLAAGVEQGSIDQLVDLVADADTRAIWH